MNNKMAWVTSLFLTIFLLASCNFLAEKSNLRLSANYKKNKYKRVLRF